MWKWSRESLYDFPRPHELQVEKQDAHRGLYCSEKEGGRCAPLVRTGVKCVKSQVQIHITECFRKGSNPRSIYWGKFVQRIFRMEEQVVASFTTVQAWVWALGWPLRKNLASSKTWEPEEISSQEEKGLGSEEGKLEMPTKVTVFTLGFLNLGIIDILGGMIFCLSQGAVLFIVGC